MNRREARGGPGKSQVPSGLVVAIFGPTASGKTAVAEALAARVPAEIVSADSMQVYRGLPILTNQPRRAAHLVGIWPLAHEGSVAEYAELAREAIAAILARRRLPIVAGGTGLYLRAALAELDVPPAPRPGSRDRWEALYDELGPTRAHGLLADRDPRAAARIHPNDRRRVVRGLELAEIGASLRGPRDRLWAGAPDRPTLLVGLEVSPRTLAERIEARAKDMIARGAEDEVRRALSEPVSTTASQAIGLRELAGLSRDEALAAIILRTRRYAAYQRKWMRRIPDVVPVDGERPPAEIAEEILTLARAGNAPEGMRNAGGGAARAEHAPG